jgi:hypothetical protein
MDRRENIHSFLNIPQHLQIDCLAGNFELSCFCFLTNAENRQYDLNTFNVLAHERGPYNNYSKLNWFGDFRENFKIIFPIESNFKICPTEMAIFDFLPTSVCILWRNEPQDISFTWKKQLFLGTTKFIETKMYIELLLDYPLQWLRIM